MTSKLYREHLTRIQESVHDLLSWFHDNKRDMPWRNTPDPYQIWLSEVMLQQTQVGQARPYFDRFTSRFPDITSLSRANIDEVLRYWEGLGYYSRARNLHKAANDIAKKHNGMFPSTFEEAIALQGIGPYTAAAVVSIAYNKPYAVVDGNVTRVICRLFALNDDVRLAKTQKAVKQIADLLLNHQFPGDHNQAMMELGATVCSPSKPQCVSCPFQNSCIAFRTKRTSEIPYKSPAKKRPHYHIAVAVIMDNNGRLLINRRPDDAMLGGLWEFPGGKQKKDEALYNTAKREVSEELGISIHIHDTPFLSIKHAYSHFSITLFPFFARQVDPEKKPVSTNGQPVKWISIHDLHDYAFPKANRTICDYLVSHPVNNFVTIPNRETNNRPSP